MANSVDPDQTAPIGAVCSGPTLFASILNLSVMLGNYLQQTTSGDNIFRCIFFLALLGLNLLTLCKDYVSRMCFSVAVRCAKIAISFRHKQNTLQKTLFMQSSDSQSAFCETAHDLSCSAMKNFFVTYSCKAICRKALCSARLMQSISTAIYTRGRCWFVRPLIYILFSPTHPDP